MMVYGYARVSTAGQPLDEQKETLKVSGGWDGFQWKIFGHNDITNTIWTDIC